MCYFVNTHFQDQRVNVLYKVVCKVINMIFNYNTNLLGPLFIVIIFLNICFKGTFPLRFGNVPVDGFTLGESTECFPEGFLTHNHMTEAKSVFCKAAYFVAWKQLMLWKQWLEFTQICGQ